MHRIVKQEALCMYHPRTHTHKSSISRTKLNSKNPQWKKRKRKKSTEMIVNHKRGSNTSLGLPRQRKRKHKSKTWTSSYPVWSVRDRGFPCTKVRQKVVGDGDYVVGSRSRSERENERALFEEFLGLAYWWRWVWWADACGSEGRENYMWCDKTEVSEVQLFELYSDVRNILWKERNYLNQGKASQQNKAKKTWHTH